MQQTSIAWCFHCQKPSTKTVRTASGRINYCSQCGKKLAVKWVPWDKVLDVLREAV